VIQSAFEQFARTRLGWPESLVGEAQIQTAQEIQGRFIAELKKQMALLLVIFGAASLGAILLIFCIFYMIVISKRKDIGILKACGTSNTSIALLFISYGIFIGVAGAILGGVIGYYFIRNINVIENGISYIFGFKIWKSSVYMFSKIPNQLDLHAAMWIMAAAVAAAAIGALIPAIAAARMRPVRILRYE
jgi:lipoprotein-releasing system permease protein